MDTFSFLMLCMLDKGLVTNYGERGGYKTGGGGGAYEVLPLRKGFSHAEGWAQKVRGGAKSFHTLKGGCV